MRGQARDYHVAERERANAPPVAPVGVRTRRDSDRSRLMGSQQADTRRTPTVPGVSRRDQADRRTADRLRARHGRPQIARGG